VSSSQCLLHKPQGTSAMIALRKLSKTIHDEINLKKLNGSFKKKIIIDL
jgi:hypothetical protein